MKRNIAVVLALAMLVALGLVANLSCGATGCADVYLEGVTIGSMSFEGKPLSGLPSQKVDVILNVNANRVTVSANGQDTIIKLSPSGAVIVSNPNGIAFTGVKPEQIQIKWQNTQ
jgi:hypothetical protein